MGFVPEATGSASRFCSLSAAVISEGINPYEAMMSVSASHASSSLCFQKHGFAHTVYALNLRQEVDFAVVLEECLVRIRHFRCTGRIPEHVVLAFGGDYPARVTSEGSKLLARATRFWTLTAAMSAFCALFKVNFDRGRPVVTGGRYHIGHILNPVDLFFQRNYNAL
jgi:hypothetical protein